MHVSSVGKIAVWTVLALQSAFPAFGAKANVAPFKRDTGSVTLQWEHRSLRVEVCSAQVIHVIASPAETIPKPIVPVAIRDCNDDAFTVAADGSAITLKTSALNVRIDRATGAITFNSSDGRRVLRETQGRRQLTPVDIGGTPAYRVEQEFDLVKDESLYGLGQHQEGFFDIRNIPVRLQQANTNISVPFLVSTKGYGLLWNNSSLSDFDPPGEKVALDPKTGEGEFKSTIAGEYGFRLDGNRRSVLRISIDGKPIVDIKNMWLPDSAGAKTFLKADTIYKIAASTGGTPELSVRRPSDGMGFASEAGQAVDYYFFYGPDLERVVAEYRKETGEAPMFPRWAYGFWQCRERYSSEQQLIDTATEFRKRQIPVDALVQDWQYWGKYGWNAMRFDEKDYPTPADMMSKLHRQDVHLMISVWGKFGRETQVDRDMAAEKLLLHSSALTDEPGEAKETEDWVDMFNPRAQKLFWSELQKGLFNDGLDAWWLDASEPEGDPLKHDNTFLGQGTLVRNAYPLYETSAVYDGQRAATGDKRVVILTRSAFAGQQRNSIATWSGDISGNWQTLRRQIPAGLSFSMSGLPYWATDIGGFFRPRDQYTSSDYRELLIRWFQFGAFSPVFRIHGFHSETEMWKYGPQVEQILIDYDKLRYRLLPYIYSEAWGVTSRGGSMMTALPFVYPNENSLRDVGDQFLFGDSLLVNPVTEPKATTRSVVLPAGDNWVDFWTGKKYRGGQAIVAEAPLDRIPLLVKEGSILPLGPNVQSAAEPADPMEIRIYPGKNADFLLYEDSGDGYGYERGEKTTIAFHWDDRGHELSIGNRAGSFPGMRSKHTFHVVLAAEGHGVGPGAEPVPNRTVSYDGHLLKVNLGKAK